MNGTHFIYLADVFCPWCYGFGPIMKKLAAEHPEIPVRVVGGNLISRPMTLAEDLAANPGLVDFWRSVEKTVGRPLTGAIEAALSGRDVRMYSPGADEILVTLNRLAPGHELDQLLDLEDLFYLKGVDMFSEAALAGIAARWAIEPEQLTGALDTEAALAATRRDLAEAEKLLGEVGSYPSIFLARGDRLLAVSRGYVRYETAASLIEDALNDLDITPAGHEGCSFAEDCTAGGNRRRS
ncbi:MAG: hypothetical protein K2G99_03735 [Desulfovibrio sp.]|nr:hypothetical protein [Desulfovibrio sp.]